VPTCACPCPSLPLSPFRGTGRDRPSSAVAVAWGLLAREEILGVKAGLGMIQDPLVAGWEGGGQC
jgi:hypothetical protein